VAPPAPPRDPTRRGTGEMVELYITSALFGAFTGAYIPTVATDDGVSGTTYALTMIGGAGLMAVGVLTLDLAAPLRTGVAPTVSESIRLGLANGLLVWGIGGAAGEVDGDAGFSLAWGGAALGLATGVAVGFGLEPSVRDARFVESVSLWGGVLGTAAALISEYSEPVLGVALTLVGLDAGLLAALATVAADTHPSTARTLLLDLGFLAGTGAGALVPSLYYFTQRTAPEPVAVGVGMAIGAVGGWLLSYLLTDGMDDAEAEADESAPQVGLSPVQDGLVVGVHGAL
ncbi:MAG TPA: hypothetical protein RMH99_03510, partial [Sandaracinaceae bacterium LLY-WYZ-13_1]|nr:hypothetical protein [Sandaracinaceae bacterium LLY-WYZ-13_1]